MVTEKILGILFIVNTIMLISGQPSPVRLMDGLNEREGRVEVFYAGEWGTICDDGWGPEEAGVICRMLNFVGAARPHDGGYFNPGNDTQPIWMDSVTCDGNEATIAACQHKGFGNSNCQHSEDAGVTCLGVQIPTTTTRRPTPSTTTLPPKLCDDPSEDVRLVGGPHSGAGRVQVRFEGDWGEVCDDRWGVTDAQVVCRMLCYNPANARAHPGPTFGNTTLDFLLDEVQCTGSEDDIFDCAHGGIGVNDCSAIEGAGVSCSQDLPTPPPVPQPDIQCEDEYITARFPRPVDPALRPEHLSLVGQDDDCGYTTSMDQDYVSIRLPFVGCGTGRQLNHTHIAYDNVVRHNVTPEDPLISRYQVFEVPVVCVLGRNGDPQNGVEPETRTVGPEYGEGIFDVSMNLFKSDRFDTPIQSFPAKIVLGDWVFVGINLRSTDTTLKVVVTRCYTTPEEDPASQPQYFLIQNKCKVESSLVFYPINDTMFAFRFRTFRFNGDHDFLYIHCKAFVCGLNEKDEQCDRTCNYGLRRRRREVESNEQPLRNKRDVTFGTGSGFEERDVDEGPIQLIDLEGVERYTLPSGSNPGASPDPGGNGLQDLSAAVTSTCHQLWTVLACALTLTLTLILHF